MMHDTIDDRNRTASAYAIAPTHTPVHAHTHAHVHTHDQDGSGSSTDESSEEEEEEALVLEHPRERNSINYAALCWHLFEDAPDSDEEEDATSVLSGAAAAVVVEEASDGGGPKPAVAFVQRVRAGAADKVLSDRGGGPSVFSTTADGAATARGVSLSYARLLFTCPLGALLLLHALLLTSKAVLRR